MSELYSEGLRSDGRRWNELRQLECRINTHPKADGSAYVEMGATKVVCTVAGPQEPELRSRAHPDHAVVTVDVRVAPFAGAERRKRPNNDRRIRELASNLEQTFQQAILGHRHARTEIVLVLHVLEADGGMLPACVNAATLALVDAGIPMYDYVVAASAALYDTTALLDPTSAEESALAYVDVAVLGKSHQTLMVLLENRLPLDRVEPVLSLALDGAGSVRDQIDAEIRRHHERRAKLR